MNKNDVVPDQVFKDNDRADRVINPFLTVTAVNPKKNWAKVKRTKDIDGKKFTRDVRTRISLDRLVSSAYSLVRGVKPAEPEAPVPAVPPVVDQAPVEDQAEANVA